MTPSRAITDADLRQCSPAAMARELGWPRPPGTVSWSWALLMDVAGRRYALNRAQKADVRMTSAKGSSMPLGDEISTATKKRSVAYRHPKRGKAHSLVEPDPQPDPWDQAYSGATSCGFVLRWAFPVPLHVTAPEDRCRLCWKDAPDA